MSQEIVAFAPGRVNLIGEHTDYNAGLALAFAIAQGVTVRATPQAGRRIQVLAQELGEQDDFSLAQIDRAPDWRAFVRGVAALLLSAGVELPGARLQITATLPRGAGLSSSAALSVALCLALLALSGERNPDPLTVARLCRSVENRWAGAQSGLLDQLTSLHGAAGRALLIDFGSLRITPVPLDLAGHRLLTLDSGELRRLACGGGRSASPYNERRAECERACELLGVASLSEATAGAVASLPAPLRARARHVLTENIRVRRTRDALARGDLRSVGELLNASHASLRDNFEVSTPAVERAVQRLLDAGALGARLIGGGFGGHVLGLLPAGAVAPAGATEVEPGPGAGLL